MSAIYPSKKLCFSIEKGWLLDIVEHPNQEKYSGQRIFIVNINNYAYLIPFVETEKEVFLKTIIPSRIATKRYLGSKQQEGVTMTENELNLSSEEKDILETYEADEWQSVENHKTEMSKYQEYASATFKKDKRVNIRISTKNLEALQKKALEEGIPYQTLISSVLHKYINGRLVEQR